MPNSIDNYLPPYMHLPESATDYSARDNVRQLLEAVVAGNLNAAKEILPQFKPSLQDHTPSERLEKWGLIARDNVLNLNHLKANLCNPKGEWAHTGHIFYRAGATDYWVMQHYWMRQLVCADIVVENTEGIFLGKGDVPYKWKRFTRLERMRIRTDEDALQLEKKVSALSLGVYKSSLANVPLFSSNSEPIKVFS